MSVVNPWSSRLDALKALVAPSPALSLLQLTHTPPRLALPTMAPSTKKTKLPPSFKQDFLQDLTTANLHLDSSSSSDLLPPQLVARAYGLAPPRPDAPQPLQDLCRTCPSRYTPAALEAAASSKASTSKSKQTEVLVLDSDDDDEDLSPKKPTLTKLKRGTKGKEKEHDVPPPCTEANCSKNPRCLNWLGQAKWEDSGAFLLDDARDGRG